MLTSALLVLALGQYPQHRLAMQPNLPSGSPYAFLEFAPASGRGMGGECACSAVTTADGRAISFTRASVAECPSNDGQRLTQCAVDQPAVSSGTAASSVLGIWHEPVRNNYAWWSRDLSQATWAKTSMTCTKTATGMRNDTNGASTCTASGANGTVLQAIIYGAATQNTSFHIKRRTGTGTVEVTRNNGTTWTAVNASLSTTLWKRVVSGSTFGGDIPGCAGGNCIVVPALTSGIANPTIGIRIVTSGDAVDVDFVQDEETAVASTPIATVGVNGSRAEPIIDIAAPLSPTASTGFSFSAIGVTGGDFRSGGSVMPVNLGDGTVGSTTAPTVYVWPYTANASGRVAVDMSGVNSSGTSTWDPFYAAVSEVSTQMGWHHTGAVIKACQRGVCDVGSAAVLGTPVFTRLLLGRRSTTATTHFNGVIKQVCLDASGRCAPTNSGPIAWVGDSIIYGNASLPRSPPVRLAELSNKGVVNFGVGSSVIAGCGARYTASIATGGYQTLVWSCGVNDMAAGTAGATAATAAQVFLADARARGMKVIITGIMPWKNSAGWTLAKQTETVAYNSAMSTWAGANGAFYVPTIASMGGGSGDADILDELYASVDLIHPIEAGALQLATLVYAAAP